MRRKGRAIGLRILPLMMAFAIGSPVLAQETELGQHYKEATEGLVRDGMFLEGGGHGIYWSLNYERTRYWSSHLATHGRIGLGVYSKYDLLIAVPVTFSGSYGGSSRAEAGLGVVPFVIKSPSYRGLSNVAANVMMPVFHVGYRYQHYDGNWFLRAGALLAYFQREVEFNSASEHWGWNPYLSVGLLF